MSPSVIPFLELLGRPPVSHQVCAAGYLLHKQRKKTDKSPSQDLKLLMKKTLNSFVQFFAEKAISSPGHSIVF